MITHIGCVVLYVADQEKSLDFYTNKLGFTEVTNAEMAPGKRWIEVAPPGASTTFTLLKAADFDVEPGSATAPTMRCDDLQQTCNQLRTAGVDVSEPITEPWNSYIVVTDPDGYTLVVSEPSQG